MDGLILKECTCLNAVSLDGTIYVRDPWCPQHKSYEFEYETKPEQEGD